MYDDILGPKRKADKKLKTIWNKTYWKKNSTFQVDYATPNGRTYPTHVVRDALRKRIPAIGYKKDFFLVYDTPKDPTIVQLDHVIGIVLAYQIRGIDILLEIQYLKGNDAYSAFDIALCCLGDVDEKNVVKSPLEITQVYMI